MGSLQARFRRFKRKPGSDLMLYRALLGQRFSTALTFTDGATTYALTFDDGTTETVLTI